MRDILFRGKRINTHHVWDEGSLLKCDEKSLIYYSNELVWAIFEVVPETVGQYTGLTDKNSVKIFEGDIVEHTTFYDEKIRTGFVEYIERYGAFFIKGSGYSDNQMYAFCNFKVIGNIHDNPELLKGE